MVGKLTPLLARPIVEKLTIKDVDQYISSKVTSLRKRYKVINASESKNRSLYNIFLAMWPQSK